MCGVKKQPPVFYCNRANTYSFEQSLFDIVKRENRSILGLYVMTCQLDETICILEKRQAQRAIYENNRNTVRVLDLTWFYTLEQVAADLRRQTDKWFAYNPLYARKVSR